MPRSVLLSIASATLMLLGASGAAQAQLATAQRDALVSLYNSTAGAGWTNSANWLTGDPCADAWFGVVCGAGGTVVSELHLSNNNLLGALPDLSALVNLSKLNVDDNALTGPLTTLGSLPALTAFWGSRNQFTGFLPDLPSLSSLEYFWVMDNQLIGPIPDISGLTNLKDFRVSTNKLTGTPPTAPGGLVAGGSSLCPNYLHAQSPTDAAWSTATGETDWSRWCTPGYLVTVNATAGGSALPTPGAAVLPGESVAVALSANSGYVLDGVDGTCGGGMSNAVTFTTDAINADCTVNVRFAAIAVAAPAPVPTASSAALGALGLLAAALGLHRIRRRTHRRG